MQVNFDINPPMALEGMVQSDRETRDMTLAQLPQITTGTIGSSEAGSFVLTVVDDETSQSHSTTITLSGGGDATSLDEIKAGVEASGKINDLFSVTEDGATDFVLAARHANRAYTVSATPPGSMTTVFALTQASGGSGVEMGRMMRRVAGEDYQFDALTPTTTVDELVGTSIRLDGNHFHLLENDTPSAIDTLDRGRTHSLLEEGEQWVKVEEAVTPSSTVYCRRALTASAGRLGGFRASAAGGQKVVTVTPTAVNDAQYSILIEWDPPGSAKKQSIPLTVVGDGTATATEICDDYRTASAAALADGVLAGFTFTGTATLVITGPAGQDFEVVDVGTGVSAVAETTPADVDALDISKFARFRSSAPADGLALLHVNMV